MAETAQTTGAIRESWEHVREQASPQRVERRLDEAVRDKPLIPHLLDLRVVGKAVAIAAVLAAIVSLLLSPKLGAIVLVVAFGIGWVALANRRYNRRRPTSSGDGGSEDGG